MARELGMNPRKLGSLTDGGQEPWKLPLPEFIVHKVAEEKSSGEKRIGLERGDVDSHSLVRVGEVLREQLRGVSEAGDAAVGVMQAD
jgi:hypothetical protein